MRTRSPLCCGLMFVAIFTTGAAGQGIRQSGSTASSSFGTQTSGSFGTRTMGQGIQGSTGLGTRSGQSLLGGGTLQTPGQGMGQAAPGQQRQQGFVGRQGTDMEQFFSGLQRASDTFRQELGIGGGQGRGGQGRGQTQRPTVRISLRVAFEYPQRRSTQVVRSLEQRLVTVLEKRVQSPEILVSGRTVTLRGKVSSEHQRVLAAELARQEPGVSTVQNELVFDPFAAQGQP